MDDNNWDLFAVVRGCSAAAAPVTDPFSHFRGPLPSSGLKDAPMDGGAKSELFGFPDPMATSTSSRHGRLEEVCRTFHMEVRQQPTPGLLPQQLRQRQQKLQPLLPPKSSYSSAACTATSLFPNIGGVPRRFQEHTRLQPHRPNSSNPRNSKRRKNQLKKVVCQMPADGASSDLWAWRKYGQKPIKGSPYPRGYYRCSSSKGCQARKQVERSRADPAILIITYTAEHNHPVPTHRNSLAGSTRQKFPTPSSAPVQPHASSPSASGRTDQLRSSTYPSSNSLSSPSTAARLSPTSSLAESTENDHLLQTQLPLKTDRQPVEEEEDDDEGGEDVEEAQHKDEEEEEEDEGEELLTVGDMEMMGAEDMVFFGMEVLRGPPADTGTTQLPATVSATSDFFKDEDAIDDHFFRSSWLPNNNAATAASGR